MNGANMLAPRNAQLVHLLNAFDEARRILRAAEAVGGDAAASEESRRALSVAPQFVVVGAQSAGKSSVLSRLSGVELPTHSERCTRVATLLKLRRVEEERPVEVAVVGTWKDAEINERVDVTGSSADAIRTAQQRALAICEIGGKDDFVSALEIEVTVMSPRVPNVTLVDLPGLLAPTGDSQSPEAVERLVRKYADMDGSLLLYVVPLNQDFDTVLGKTIISRHRRKTTCVLTRLDAVASTDVTSRLEKVVRETAEPRVVVLGNKSHDEEASWFASEGLRRLGEATSDVLVGCDELRRVVEERISAQVAVQLPVMLEVVAEQRRRCDEKLKRLERRVPALDALEAAEAIRGAVAKNEKQTEDFFRGVRERVACDVKNLYVRAVRNSPDGAVMPADAEDRFVGARVWARTSKEATKLKLATLVSVNEGTCTCKFETESGSTTEDVPNNGIYSQTRVPEDMVKDVKAVANEIQGLRNLAHVDPQHVIETYALDFADRYRRVFLNAHKECHAHVTKAFDAAFNDERVPETVRLLAGELAGEMRKRLESIRQDALKCIERLTRYNARPLVFTTNEHYVDQIFRDLLARSKLGSTDSGSAEVLYLRVLAYWKVQVKVVIETGTKDLTGLYVIDAARAFDEVLGLLKSEAFIVRVQDEPRARARERERLQRVRADLERVEGVLSGL